MTRRLLLTVALIVGLTAPSARAQAPYAAGGSPILAGTQIAQSSAPEVVRGEKQSGGDTHDESTSVEHGVEIIRGSIAKEDETPSTPPTEDIATERPELTRFVISVDGFSDPYEATCWYIDAADNKIERRIDGVMPDAFAIDAVAIECRVFPKIVAGTRNTIQLWADDILVAERYQRSAGSILVRSDGPWGNARSCCHNLRGGGICD